MQVQANRAAVPDDVKQLVDALVPPPRTSPPISAAAAALSPAPTVAVPPIPRPTEPKQFLDALAGKDSTDETFTFQTFDDDNTRRDGSLAVVRHGRFGDVADKLEALGRRGAGIFVTINKTNGGRKAENVTKVRAVFIDLDGAPLDPARAWKLPPHIIVESSPGKYHVYWRVDGSVGLEQFKPMQRALATLFNGDPSVCDLPRVLRLPGFSHQKGQPFTSRIIEARDAPPYTFDQIESALEGIEPRATSVDPSEPIGDASSLCAPSVEHVRLLLSARPNTNLSRADWVRDAHAIKAATAPWPFEGYELFCERSDEYEGGSKPEDVDHLWESIKASKIGYRWLLAEARKLKFYGDAQYDFDDDPVPPEFLGGTLPRLPEHIVSEEEAANAARISATQFVLRPATSIEPRQFLYDRHYQRKFLSATVAPGGAGKSALAITEAVSMAVGRQLLLHNQPIKQRRVWYINLEDPKDEIERRIAAIAQHFGISAADFGGRLYVNSGRDAEIVIAREQRGELVVVKPVISAMRQSVMDNGIDVLIIDPFVASHAVSESDNGKINAVCQQWRMIAEETGCAVETVHHVRKGAQGQKSEYTADDARGASALVNAARSVRVLNRMTKEDAAKAGIEDHWSYFRVDNGKSNFARPAENTVWRRIISVALGNSRVDDPGDDVGVVVPWRWPDPFEQVTPEDVRAIQQKVSGGEWRGDARANDWVGRAVAEVLGLDPGQPSAKAAIKSMLRGWIEAGILKVVTRKDARRMNRPYVVVGKWEEAR